MSFDRLVNAALEGIPKDPAQELNDIVKSTCKVIFNRFQLDKRNPDSFLDAQIATLHAIDMLMNKRRQELVQINQTGKPLIACKEGCHHCCYQRVTANPCQVFTLTQSMKLGLRKADFEELKQIIHESARLSQPLTDDQWESTRIGCPLLIQGSCAGYNLRPTACRGYNSTSESACKDKLDKIGDRVQIDIIERAIASLYELYFTSKLASIGIDSRQLELIAGLDTALQTPDALKRWLAGDMTLFAKCVHIPSRKGNSHA